MQACFLWVEILYEIGILYVNKKKQELYMVFEKEKLIHKMHLVNHAQL